DILVSLLKAIQENEPLWRDSFRALWPTFGRSSVIGAIKGAGVATNMCSRTAEAIMHCMISNSLGANTLDEVSAEVLFRQGSVEGIKGLKGPAMVGSAV
ncbi:UNVERIFIED_CONTAM: hypothetical protein Sindi_1650000, partial [Sesamum indicum]